MVETVQRGEQFPAKLGRTGFALDFLGSFVWREKIFDTKRIEAY